MIGNGSKLPCNVEVDACIRAGFVARPSVAIIEHDAYLIKREDHIIL